MASRTYKIRKFSNGKTKDGGVFWNYSLTIPAPVAEKLPQDMLFECELTEAGILFRPVQEAEELPSWAQSEEAPANGKTSRRARPARA